MCVYVPFLSFWHSSSLPVIVPSCPVLDCLYSISNHHPYHFMSLLIRPKYQICLYLRCLTNHLPLPCATLVTDSHHSLLTLSNSITFSLLLPPFHFTPNPCFYHHTLTAYLVFLLYLDSPVIILPSVHLLNCVALDKHVVK